MRFLIVMLLIASCGSTKKKETIEIDTAELAMKRELYLQLITKHQGSAGFVQDHNCDGLLWNSLAAVSGVGGINLHAAESVPGRWFRTPGQDCYPDRSKSSISRDMILGLSVFSLFTKNQDIPRNLLAYGEANDWVMGEGVRTRTYLSPSMRRTIADILYFNGGEERKLLRKYPLLWFNNSGYQAHLDLLQALVRSELGPMPNAALSVLTKQYERNPNNAFTNYLYHKYTDGKFDETVSILLNPQLFPPTRLPHTQDRCTDYLWQRDPGPDWEPCTKNEEHPGIDFLFVSYLVLREFY